MTNVDPPDSVPKGRETAFRGLYGKCIQEKLQEFPEESKREDLREAIDTQRQHRKLISYSIFPFSQGEPGGYKFIKTEPLEELGVPNFDFLLWNFDGSVILGEAKSSIPDSAERVVNQLDERKSVAEDHREYLETEYLGDDIDHMEFVVSTYVQHGDAIATTVMEQGVEVIPWVVDPHSGTLWVHHARPSSFPNNLDADDPDAMLEELEIRHTHADASLNSDLDRVKTGFGQIDVLPSAIIVDQLRAVVQARQVIERYPCLDKADLISYVSGGMFNYSSDRVDEIVSNLIEAGKRINFLSDWDDPQSDLKIVSNYTAKDDLEQVLESKWVDWRIESMKDKLRKECRECVLAEIDKQSQLDEFMDIGV